MEAIVRIFVPMAMGNSLLTAFQKSSLRKVYSRGLVTEVVYRIITNASKKLLSNAKSLSFIKGIILTTNIKVKNNDIQQIAYIAVYEDVVASRDSHNRPLHIHPVRRNDDFRYYCK